ncbi:MAG TPA: nucleotide exchange factor GrpE [Patescibacteria group bacterium]
MVKKGISKKDSSRQENLSEENLKKIEELENKASELQDKLVRSLADYSNLEKRIESQRQLFVTLATTAVISKMVDVLDDLLLAQTHLQDQGLQIAIDKFKSTLKSEGLEEISAVGQSFDPSCMECIDVASGKNDHVLEVKKVGYKLNGHCIRPAAVIVGRES